MERGPEPLLGHIPPRGLEGRFITQVCGGCYASHGGLGRGGLPWPELSQECSCFALHFNPSRWLFFYPRSTCPLQAGCGPSR